ncbi:unnamed protein product [Thelazia callipaeda]|uniref:Rad4 domain-containing protein n=1 Tax=Thelazia callipaeda TaxID=103827 RepID=A0A158RBS0_THECL|nr:unnamed protein product [Thelazia callipaeda]
MTSVVPRRSSRRKRESEAPSDQNVVEKIDSKRVNVLKQGNVSKNTEVKDNARNYVARVSGRLCRNAKKKKEIMLENDLEPIIKKSRNGTDAGSTEDLKPNRQRQRNQSSKRKISDGEETYQDESSDSSISDDEWEDVDLTDQHNYEPSGMNDNVEVTISASRSKETEESKWAKFIRQQVNRKIRERQINCHKMHLLCYIAHLRVWIRALVRDEALASLCLSLIPEGYLAAAKHTFDVATAERFLKWFRSAFQRTYQSYVPKTDYWDYHVRRLKKLIEERVYENDKDLSSLLFLCLVSLNLPARLCLSCQPVTQKPSMNMLRSKYTEIFVEQNVDNSDSCEIWEMKLNEVLNKIEVKSDEDYCEKHNSKNRQRSKNEKKKKPNKNGDTISSKILSSGRQKCGQERNYWVEYWDRDDSKWICMDPWFGSVDMPESLEMSTTAPMHYVLCIDDDLGMRDVTARYASKFLSADVRRLRVEPSWWTNTLKLYRSKNRRRERIEDIAIHNELLSKPKPATIAEYKNHPLYVLKKDILKYEAIYPENQASIGQIRGIDIYPRSSVFHLDTSLNWMKQARVVKKEEKPYKVVKGRVNHRVAPELREPRSLELYGYWQTEPYVPPKVVDERIPRNEFGNIYVYKSSMVPEECVHVRLDGLVTIARKLDIDCVPAVVGWDFHKGGNHPIVDGCVVLKKHENMLRKVWKEFHQKKQIAFEQKRKERALKNWRRLTKGMLTMRKVRAKFLRMDRRSMRLAFFSGDVILQEIDEKLEDQVLTPAPDDTILSWPHTIFNLPESTVNRGRR